MRLLVNVVLHSRRTLREIAEGPGVGLMTPTCWLSRETDAELARRELQLTAARRMPQ